MSDVEFTVELRDWLVQQVRGLDEQIKRVCEDRRNSGWQQFEPTEEEERADNEQNDDEDDRWPRRPAKRGQA